MENLRWSEESPVSYYRGKGCVGVEPSEGVLSVKLRGVAGGEVITATVSYSGVVRRSVSQELRQLAGQHGEDSGELNCTGYRDG